MKDKINVKNNAKIIIQMFQNFPFLLNKIKNKIYSNSRFMFLIVLQLTSKNDKLLFNDYSLAHQPVWSINLSNLPRHIITTELGLMFFPPNNETQSMPPHPPAGTLADNSQWVQKSRDKNLYNTQRKIETIFHHDGLPETDRRQSIIRQSRGGKTSWGREEAEVLISTEGTFFGKSFARNVPQRPNPPVAARRCPFLLTYSNDCLWWWLHPGLCCDFHRFFVFSLRSQPGSVGFPSTVANHFPDHLPSDKWLLRTFSSWLGVSFATERTRVGVSVWIMWRDSMKIMFIGSMVWNTIFSCVSRSLRQ